ncbi:MAG: UDP-N-acetylglucosamine 4,6-dehydratase (inverting), partial [Paraglaciecola sp.]|nr:UDP-N-acetylglucosamine 4,6-dehydratase (inverting) [Paraglaciecola sp.]MDP5132751.1 UDP-N-acetylglucosamine 4,6-dehydratase (inverting) [Paraglaciecola sp.]
DMSYHTYEFSDHFVIAPAIKFFHRSNDFSSNALQEQGQLVEPGFEYVSDKNPEFLSIEQMRQYNLEAMQ